VRKCGDASKPIRHYSMHHNVNDGGMRAKHRLMQPTCRLQKECRGLTVALMREACINDELPSCITRITGSVFCLFIAQKPYVGCCLICQSAAGVSKLGRAGWESKAVMVGLMVPNSAGHVAQHNGGRPVQLFNRRSMPWINRKPHHQTRFPQFSAFNVQVSTRSNSAMVLCRALENCQDTPGASQPG